MRELTIFVHRISEFIIQPLIGLLFALAFFFFSMGIWGMIINAGDPKKLDTAKKQVMWGVVGFLIMLSVFTILYIITASFCGHPWCRIYLIEAPQNL